jgi:hypothetical protein
VAWHMTHFLWVCGRCMRHGMVSSELVCVVCGVVRVVGFGGMGQLKSSGCPPAPVRVEPRE